MASDGHSPPLLRSRLFFPRLSPLGAAGKRPPPSDDTASLQTVAAAGVFKAHRNSKTNRTNVVKPVMKPGPIEQVRNRDKPCRERISKLSGQGTFRRGTFVPHIPRL